MIRIFLLAFIVIVATSQVVFAKCQFWLDDSLPTSVSLNGQTQQLISFAVESNKSDCPHFVSVSSAAGSYQRRLVKTADMGSYLPFQLYQADNNSILKDYPPTGYSEFLVPTRLSKRTTHRFRASLSIPFVFAPAGRYAARYQFKLFSGTPSVTSNPLETSRYVEFYYILPERIALSLVPSGSPFDLFNKNLTLDFGTLAVGSGQFFDIVVLSNAGMEITMSSLNDGVMTSTSATGAVDYQVSFNGGSFRSLKGSLSRPLLIAKESGVLPLRGRRIRTQVQISSLAQAKAGTYTDNIVITAATVY